MEDIRLDFELLPFGVLDGAFTLLAFKVPGFEDVDAAPGWLDAD
jgi:hypothetical protein